MTSGLIQGQRGWKIALDGVIGAEAGGGAAIFPGAVASVITGAGAASFASVMSQAVANGGFKGISGPATAFDTAIGAFVPGAGTVAAARGAGDLAVNIGIGLTGAFGTVACAFSGGKC
jgi:hypothetical protein